MKNCAVIIYSYDFVPNKRQLHHTQRAIFGFTRLGALKEYNTILETRDLVNDSKKSLLNHNEYIVEVQVVQTQTCGENNNEKTK